MSVRYTQTHERYACTEPTSHGQRFTIEKREDAPGMLLIPGITLATDRPVRQHVRGLGVVKLRLKLQVRKSLAMFREIGRLQPDGSLTMLGDHGSGDFWTPNVARDNIGRWQAFRIEQRDEGSVDAHKALMADAAVHLGLAANWLATGGGDFTRDDVESAFRNGVIRDTSIGFGFNPNTLTLEDEERQIFVAETWELIEGSWVFIGADDTGSGRAEDQQMSDKLLREIADGQKALLASHEIMTVRLGKLEKASLPDPQHEPDPQAEPTKEELRWAKLSELWARDPGEEAKSLLEILESDPERCTELSERLMAKRTEKRPPGHFRSENNGHERRFDLMRHAPIALLNSHPVTAPSVAGQISELPQSLRTAPLSTFVEHFARQGQLVPEGYTARDPMAIFEIFRDTHEPPRGAVRSRTLGGHWLPGEGALYDHNGILDVDACLRSAAGTVVAADFPALLVSILILAYDGSYNSVKINIDAWSRRKDQDTLDERPIVRADVAVPTFDRVIQAGEDMPMAARWHDRKFFQVFARGFLYTMSMLDMLRDGGGFLVDNPVLLGDGWAGEESRYCVGKITGHDFGTLGQAFNRSEAILDFLNHVFTTAHVQVPVARPTTIDKDLASRKIGDRLLPNKLIYGPELEADISNFFKGRLTEAGRLPADTQVQDALTDWMVDIGRSRERTAYIDARLMYLFVAGGTWSSLIHGSLRGRSGVQIRVVDDTNWKRFEEIGTRWTQIFECQVHQENTLYQNLVP